jgi:23S rRNA pseudouridine1911/1915/1917 synthase
LMGLIQNATRNKIQIAATEGIFCKWRHSEVELQSKSFWCSARDADASSFENHIVPENIPLDIVYEDDTLLLINKKPGMVVHRTWKLYRDFSSCFGISFW